MTPAFTHVAPHVRDFIFVLLPREEPYPVGYYCGPRDPDGNAVEFSRGQPPGPDAGGLPL